MTPEFFRTLTHDDFANGAITNDLYRDLKQLEVLTAQLETVTAERDGYLDSISETSKTLRKLMDEKDALQRDLAQASAERQNDTSLLAKLLIENTSTREALRQAEAKLRMMGVNFPLDKHE